MATSTPVIRARIEPICAYSRGPGCFSACAASATCSSPRGASTPPRLRYSASVILGASWLYQIHEREDHDPHNIDEVPVEAGQFYIQAVLLLDPPLQRHREEREQD